MVGEVLVPQSFPTSFHLSSPFLPRSRSCNRNQFALPPHAGSLVCVAINEKQRTANYSWKIEYRTGMLFVGDETVRYFPRN